MPEPLRVFFDANVLFSASYQPEHPFLAFWRDPSVACLTSFYAADETRRNCVGDQHRQRLEALPEQTHMVSDASEARLPPGIVLPATDQPILAAARQASADYLITGDKGHFAQWRDQPIPTPTGTLTILRPRPLLLLLARRS
ncbi:MAG TPA: PIN domain-containing protein [Acidobacteriaceae bacterium]|nr:PIN domain-containing protein [Acidobacteriaceae bacterium]